MMMMISLKTHPSLFNTNNVLSKHHQYDNITKHRDLYNLLPDDIGFLPLVASTSGRLNADFIRLAYLHATEA